MMLNLASRSFTKVEVPEGPILAWDWVHPWLTCDEILANAAKTYSECAAVASPPFGGESHFMLAVGYMPVIIAL